jgi:hypothetical protein
MESSGELTSHLTAGAAIVYGLQWLKDAGWCPWLTSDTKTINRVLSLVLAAMASAGINFMYDASLEGGTLVIHGLSFSTVAHTLWEVFKQFTAQQMIYDGVVQKSGAK